MIELSIIRDLVAIFGVITGLSYYVMTVRNTKKAREAQVYTALMNQFIDDRYMRGLREFASFNYQTYEEYRAAYPDYESYENIFHVFMVLENIGGLVRGGYIGVEIIAYTSIGAITRVWEKTRPFIGEWREEWDNPHLWTEIEYLYGELIKFREKHPDIRDR